MIKQSCKHNFQINIHYSVKYSVAAFAKSCPEPNYSSLNCSLKTQNQTRGLPYTTAVHAHHKAEAWIHGGLGARFLLPPRHAECPAIKTYQMFMEQGLQLLLVTCCPPCSP